MKILFVDKSAEVQQKWLDPLRAEGWGALRARSAEDASKMIVFHAKSIDCLVVTVSDLGWAEKQLYDYILIASSWSELEITQHQNSRRPAIAYLKETSPATEIKAVVEARKSKNKSRAIPLEDISEILSRPEVTRSEVSIRLEAPGVLLGGEISNHVAPSEIAEDRTTVLDSTKLADFEQIRLNEVEEVNFETPNEIEIESLDQAVGSGYEESFIAKNDIPQNVTPIRRVRASDSQPVSAETTDLETMKNYLSLREQDVAMLTGQFRSAQERVHQLEVQLKIEQARNAELQHLVQKQEQQIKTHDEDKQIESEVLFKQVEDLNFQLNEKTEKVRLIETKLKHATLEIDKIKERVRVDIRRIRVREKELESQLEVIKKDSSALLIARDEKIVELKRKLDLLEFNMELVQDQYQKERNTSEQLRNRLKDAAVAMRQAGGFLDQEH